MLKKLRLRLTALCTATTAVILCGASLLLLAASEKQLMKNVSVAFDGNIASIAYRLQNERTVDWDWLNQMETDQQLAISIYDNGVALKYPGTWQTATDRARLFAALKARSGDSAAPAGGRGYTAKRFTMTGSSQEPYLAAAVTIPAYPKYRTLLLIKDLRDVDLKPLRRFCLAVAGGSLLILAGFSWWFSGRAIAPVERSARQQTEFVAAASHELRTPLSVMRASASALKYESTKKGVPFAEAIERECARLGRLVEDLLTLAAADAGRMPLRKGPVEPEALLMGAMEAFLPLAAEKNVELSVEPSAGTLPILAGDEQRLTQLLSILIDNALQYVPPGNGKIRLSAERFGKAVSLFVRDNGPGVPEEQREQVFRRFYRLDPARSKKEHYGLGLAIASDIARLHGGILALSETPGGGLTVEYRQNAAV